MGLRKTKCGGGLRRGLRPDSWLHRFVVPEHPPVKRALGNLNTLIGSVVTSRLYSSPAWVQILPLSLVAVSVWASYLMS